MAKQELSAYDIAETNRKRQEQPEPGSGLKLLRLPQQGQASAPSEALPNPITTPFIFTVRARQSPGIGVGMFNLRGAKQRQAMRSAFRSNSPTKRNFWSKEEQEKRDKETAEWEKDPGKDETFEALTQTGGNGTQDVEMTQTEERAMAEWMAEGKRLLEEEERQQGPGFEFLGKEGRGEREFVLSAVHSFKCKWEAQTMHVPSIDIGVPTDQRYRAMRTQITQQVERLECKCYIAFEERKMEDWLGKQREEVKQVWVLVMDNEDPRTSDERIVTIFFTKHDEDCK